MVLFSLLHVPDTVLILRHIEQDNVIKFSEILPSVYIGLNVKYALLLPDFTWTIIFLTDFLKVPKYQSSRKFVQFEAKLFHVDRQTDKKTNRQT